MIEVIDLTNLFPGPATLEDFPKELVKIDFSAYQGKDVQLKGCLPSWAFLMVAGKLFGRANSLQFLVDDGKAGIPITVFQKS